MTEDEKAKILLDGYKCYEVHVTRSEHFVLYFMAKEEEDIYDNHCDIYQT